MHWKLFFACAGLFCQIWTHFVCDDIRIIKQMWNTWNSWFLGNSLHWRHNGHDGVSNHQPHGCLLNRLFRRRSKKTSKLRVTGLCAWNSPGPVNAPHKGPVTRKMFPFDDVIMYWWLDMITFSVTCLLISSFVLMESVVALDEQVIRDYNMTARIFGAKL